MTTFLYFRFESMNGTSGGKVKNSKLEHLILGEEYNVTIKHEDQKISQANATISFHACKYLDRQMDGLTDGQRDGQPDRKIDGQLDGYKDGQIVIEVKKRKE